MDAFLGMTGNVKNWGTKWEVTLDKSEIPFDEYNLQFYCDSAWCPPNVLLQDIADKYNVNVEQFLRDRRIRQ